jgi:hypothetical protein
VNFKKKIVEQVQFWFEVNIDNDHCIFSMKDVITIEICGSYHILSRAM